MTLTQCHWHNATHSYTHDRQYDSATDFWLGTRLEIRVHRLTSINEKTRKLTARKMSNARRRLNHEYSPCWNAGCSLHTAVLHIVLGTVRVKGQGNADFQPSQNKISWTDRKKLAQLIISSRSRDKWSRLGRCTKLVPWLKFSWCLIFNFQGRAHSPRSAPHINLSMRFGARKCSLAIHQYISPLRGLIPKNLKNIEASPVQTFS